MVQTTTEKGMVAMVTKLTEKLNTYKEQNKKICIHLHMMRGSVSNHISVGEFKISNQEVYLTDEGEEFVLDLKENVKSIVEDEFEDSFLIKCNQNEVYVDFI